MWQTPTGIGGIPNPVVLTGLTLSGSQSFPGSSPSGTAIGTIAVSAVNGAFTGVLSLSGTNASSFQIVGNALQTNGVVTIGNYTINIVATESGAAGSPLTVSFTINGTSVGAESPAGTDITTVGPGIDASPTPGSPGSGNVLTITSGGQIALNGTVLGGAGVVELYYLGHTAYQFNGTNWYGPITATSTGVQVINPKGVLSTITLGGSTFTGGAASGTVVGAIGVVMSSGTFTGTLSLSGTNASSFQIVGTNLETNGVVPAGTYALNVVATQPGATGSPLSVPFTITGSVPATLSNITISNSSFAGGSASGAVVGAITVVMSSGVFTGALSLSGTNASSFQIVGSNLETSGVVPAGSYNINIIATQAGAAGSPLTIPFAITGTPALSNVTLNNSSFTGGAASGTVVGAITVVMQSGSFTGSLSLSGTNASSFQIVGTNLETNGVVPAGSYSINIIATQAGAAGSPLTIPFTITANAPAALSNITLSNSGFTGGAASGTVVGAITVVMSNGSFTGSLSLSGTNASSFQIVGTNLETNGVVATGSYSINIVATQAGATGSPLTVPFTITGSSSSAQPYTLTPFSSLAQTTGATSPLGWPVDFFDDFNGTFTRTNFPNWTNRQSPNGFTTGATYGGSTAQYGCSIQAVWGGGYNGTDNVNNISMSGSKLIFQMTNVGGVINTAACNLTWPTCWGLWEWNVSCSTNPQGTAAGINLGLWMDPWNYWPSGVECDVQESAGTNGLHTTVWWLSSGSQIHVVAGNAYPTGGATDGNFHTYSCVLTPAYMASYIDGTLMGSTNSSNALGGFTVASMSTDPPTSTRNPSWGFNLATVNGTPASITQSGNLWLVIMGLEGAPATTAQCPVTMQMDWFRHSKMTPATGGHNVTLG